MAVLGSGAQVPGGAETLRRQQRGFEGARSGALTRSEHLAGEMVKGVVSFWGGTGPPGEDMQTSTQITASTVIQHLGHMTRPL